MLLILLSFLIPEQSLKPGDGWKGRAVCKRAGDLEKPELSHYLHDLEQVCLSSSICKVQVKPSRVPCTGGSSVNVGSCPCCEGAGSPCSSESSPLHPGFHPREPIPTCPLYTGHIHAHSAM